METPPHIVRFGPFEVNLQTGELRKRGIRIALQEQPRRILSALVEETITQLASACRGHVAVIARTSVLHLSGKDKSAAEIGRALGASYLLQGSVRRESTRVRITAQLIAS